jgi:L-iditol 2-dehydrogenase
MAKNRGWINLFGGLPKDGSVVPLDTNLIHYKELFVCGSHGCMPRHHQKAVDLIADGVINVKQFISHRFALDEAQAAFAAAEDRAGLRVVIRP